MVPEVVFMVGAVLNRVVEDRNSEVVQLLNVGCEDILGVLAGIEDTHVLI
jgi:hypothetical protein